MEFMGLFLLFNFLGFASGFALTMVADAFGRGWSSTLAGEVLLLYPIIIIIMLGMYLSGGFGVSTANLESIKGEIFTIGFFGSFALGVHSCAWLAQGKREGEEE